MYYCIGYTNCIVQLQYTGHKIGHTGFVTLPTRSFRLFKKFFPVIVNPENRKFKYKGSTRLCL